MSDVTNPKDAIGVRKAPFSCVSAVVIAEIGLGMLEGACKYGRHNYRVAPVRASIYYDAALRHLTSWFEGEDLDPESGLSHVTKALASLAVIRDAMINESWTDDRPPRAPSGWLEKLNEKAGDILDKYKDKIRPAFLASDKPAPAEQLALRHHPILQPDPGLYEVAADGTVTFTPCAPLISEPSLKPSKRIG